MFTEEKLPKIPTKSDEFPTTKAAIVGKQYNAHIFERL